MPKNSLNIIKNIMAIMLLGIALIACDPNRQTSKISKQTENKKICYSDAGGSFGKAGLRARQFIGKGPKMRVTQWKTPNFMDDFQIVQTETEKGSKPNIAVLISWRVNVVNNIVESSFESFEAYSLNLTEAQILSAHSWKIEIYDGETFISKTSPANKEYIRDLFSTESKGIIIPAQIGEALGGVNGGKFVISLLDINNNVIVERVVMPPKAYEFKNNAKTANENLDALLQNPEKCEAPTTQLRTQ